MQSAIRQEIEEQLRIAGPLALTALVNMGMSITDVMMMGMLGSVAVAAGAVASDLYSIVFYVCSGVTAALSPIVSAARGAHEHRVIRRATQQAFWAAGLLALPGALAIAIAPRLLGAIGVAGEVVAGAKGYAAMMALTLVPMLGIAVWRQFLASFASTQAILRIVPVTLGLNALGNYAFMFGNLGMPRLELAGAGLSSALCALFMFAMLTRHVLRDALFARYRLLLGAWRPDWPRLAELFRLGLPIGVSGLGEVGVYLLSTTVVGIFGTSALAAHAVALRMAGVLYALPLGLSQAATVRVALAAGAHDAKGQRRAAQVAVAMAAIAGAAVLPLIVYARHDIASLFVRGGGAEIAVAAAALLVVLAYMQVFEYVGTVAAGVLRGVRDTRAPMWLAVASFWGVGAMLGVGLGFGRRLEVEGVWLGLAAGAVAFSVLLLARLRSREDFVRESLQPLLAPAGAARVS